MKPTTPRSTVFINQTIEDRPDVRMHLCGRALADLFVRIDHGGPIVFCAARTEREAPNIVLLKRQSLGEYSVFWELGEGDNADCQVLADYRHGWEVGSGASRVGRARLSESQRAVGLRRMYWSLPEPPGLVVVSVSDTSVRERGDLVDCEVSYLVSQCNIGPSPNIVGKGDVAHE